MTGSLSSQGLNYREIFGEDWVRAEEFVRENRLWMEQILKENDIQYDLAVAVIFPELVRYSALRDKMETTLLKALYINLGGEYANFSIGRFQIKPSFAEIIRTESAETPVRKLNIRFQQPYEFDHISNYRKSIVADLEDTKTGFSYIVAFIKICERKFRTGKMHEEERLLFLATAYNYGIDRSPADITGMINRRFFTTSLFRPVKYSYSDISLYYFRQNPEQVAVIH